MPITLVGSEQVIFNSARTGRQSLDVYLEACEFGDQTLSDLLSQLFTPDGDIRIITFRNNNNVLEYRVSQEDWQPLADFNFALNAAQDAQNSADQAVATLNTFMALYQQYLQELQNQVAQAQQAAADAANSAIQAATFDPDNFGEKLQVAFDFATLFDGE